MEVLIHPDAHTATQTAARIIARQIRTNPRTVLGLATGSTPLGVYRELIRLHREEALSFSQVTTFNLDEYVGVPADHPASYRHFMQDNLFNHIDIPTDQTHVPDGMASDISTHCADYEARIVAAGGIDIQVLGIGSDGHIGFNEPTSSLASRTRIKTLTEQTRQDNARFFDRPGQVPIHCITMGIGTILESRRCILLAFGENKAAATAASIEGPVAAMMPASALQLHPDTVVLLDEAAASQLTQPDYYRRVADMKPDWQRY